MLYSGAQQIFRRSFALVFDFSIPAGCIGSRTYLTATVWTNCLVAHPWLTRSNAHVVSGATLRRQTEASSSRLEFHCSQSPFMVSGTHCRPPLVQARPGNDLALEGRYGRSRAPASVKPPA